MSCCIVNTLLADCPANGLTNMSGGDDTRSSRPIIQAGWVSFAWPALHFRAGSIDHSRAQPNESGSSANSVSASDGPCGVGCTLGVDVSWAITPRKDTNSLQ